MSKLQFTTFIQAPVSVVWDKMLGLSGKTSYEQWTALFNPTSSYEGNWEKGSKMLFIGTDENGDKGGMVSIIAEHLPHQFISIQHVGLLMGGKEITEGKEVEQWANGFENYTFNSNNEGTLLTVDLDTPEAFMEYMNEHYPHALNKLKEICEA